MPHLENYWDNLLAAISELPTDAKGITGFDTQLFQSGPWRGQYSFSFLVICRLAHMVYAMNQICFSLSQLEEADYTYMVNSLGFDILTKMESNTHKDVLFMAYKILAYWLLQGKAWVKKKTYTILFPGEGHKFMSPASMIISLCREQGSL